MPLYEYQCEKCAHRFEVIQKFSDAPIEVCPKCGGGPVVKLLSSPAIQFKGSGWYITDYARKGESTTTTPSSSSSSSETKTESKTEIKTETKTEAKTKTESKPSE